MPTPKGYVALAGGARSLTSARAAGATDPNERVPLSVLVLASVMSHAIAA